jgi:HEAT repeat protein
MDRPAPAVEEEIARCIAGLDAAEFEASSGAAGRLVEIGVPAVPYLGFAASKAHAEGGKHLRIVLDAILMAASPEQIALLLASPYPDVRVAAAGACGERRLAELGPPLVDLLEDEDVDVRRAGIASLRKLANQFYGYRADDPPARRDAAVARWREHWKG